MIFLNDVRLPALMFMSVPIRLVVAGGGCAWVASICVAIARSAHLTFGIAQFFGVFRRSDATLNLRVVGSIPTRLTRFS
jgi:hypothetical protein